MLDKNVGECVRCGAETELQFQGTWICETCYIARSSCCPEFGPDDLTEKKADEEDADEKRKNPNC